MSDLPSNLTNKQWNPDDRPRGKLKEKGSKAHSVDEFLAIIIGSGSQGESIVELMKRILHHQKNRLMDLENISLQNLMQFKGVGLVKGMILAHNNPSGNLIPSPQDHNITQKFIKVASNFDILILDHPIVSEKRYFSFKDEKLI